MKVIFLDISGTLTNYAWSEAQRLARQAGVGDYGYQDVDPVQVSRVNQIVEATGAQIVVSSDWVKHEPAESYPGVQVMLRKHGLVATFAGHTIQPRENTVVERGLEIRAWLDEHLDVTGYVILDDAAIPITRETRKYMNEKRIERGWKEPLPPNVPELGRHFIYLDWQTGLQDEHVEQAIKILNRKS